MTQVATASQVHAVEEGPWLQNRSWDRIFVTGGAFLVAIPIILYYALRSSGVALTTAEDLVTLVVMVLVGGPHVFATYTRTFLEPGFMRRERGMAYGAFVVLAIVAGAALASAFLGAAIGGHPLMNFVLTFFFFWAGIHIVHQASYCAACYEVRGGGEAQPPARHRKLWNALDYLVMLGCLYPVAFFRMSMVPSGADTSAANPDALATVIVRELSGSMAFADDYLFRIGRVAPILPDFVKADWFWLGFATLYLGLLLLWAWKSFREYRDGTLNRPRLTLVAATVGVGLVVPLFPNLDTSFQGFNTWHSFQYLGIVWLWNRRALDRGQVFGELRRKLSQPGAHMRFYGTAIGVTASLLIVILAAGYAIELMSGGKFAMFGHDQLPIDPVTGRPVYRPGAVLLAYYTIAFSMLLVHYLHDGVFFFRPRDLVDAPKRA